MVCSKNMKVSQRRCLGTSIESFTGSSPSEQIESFTGSSPSEQIIEMKFSLSNFCLLQLW